jgi:hypothetical protein
MQSLASLLILAAVHSAPMVPERAEAVEVYGCDFEAAHDLNFDDWPDGWTRRSGADYPFYVQIGIENESGANGAESSNRCLGVHMDGGAAAVHCQPVAVSSSFSYLLSCRVRTSQLTAHTAFLSLIALDEKQEIVSYIESATVHEAVDWTMVEIGPWAPPPEARHVVLSLQVRPLHRGALFGTAWFDEVRVARLPRVTLSGDDRFNIYSDVAEPVVNFRVSGIRQREPRVHFILTDVYGRQVAEHHSTMATRQMTFADEASKADAPAAAYSGEVLWQPPIPDVGFYRISATIESPDTSPLQRSITLAVVEEADARGAGIFGWCFPHGDTYIPIKQLAQLATTAHLSWIKYPVWFADGDTATADRIAWLAERMAGQGIQFVAVLCNPPAEKARELLGEDADSPQIAVVFAQPEAWKRLVNPVITRLSLKVRWWQLGADNDLSYVGLAQLEERIREILDHFGRFGQEIRLGLVWNWLEERPAAIQAPWSFLSCVTQPPFTARELENNLSEVKQSGAHGGTWILVDPLPIDRHSTDARARDLVLRMVAAQTAGAEAAFISDPFDPLIGLINPDGTPRELFLPWRTTAAALSGCEYLGQLQLPGNSQNRVFARDGQAIIAIWNDQPTREALFLGDAEDVRQLDIWGRSHTPEEQNVQGSPVQVLDVGPLPTFVIGANLAIARVRIDFAFDKEELSSAVGQEQVVSFHFRNAFPQGMSGDVVLHAPNAWTVQPERLRFKAAADEQQVHAFRIFLGPNASSGPQLVQIDFDVRADRAYRFSVYRTIRIGHGDVGFEIFATLNDDGELVVEQHLINKSDQEVSFNCLLFLGGRRERRQILHAPRGRRIEVYAFPQGASFAGETLWLRAEEIGGKRLMNYHFTVEP